MESHSRPRTHTHRPHTSHDPALGKTIAKEYLETPPPPLPARDDRGRDREKCGGRQRNSQLGEGGSKQGPVRYGTGTEKVRQ